MKTIILFTAWVEASLLVLVVVGRVLPDVFGETVCERSVLIQLSGVTSDTINFDDFYQITRSVVAVLINTSSYVRVHADTRSQTGPFKLGKAVPNA